MLKLHGHRRRANTMTDLDTEQVIATLCATLACALPPLFFSQLASWNIFTTTLDRGKTSSLIWCCAASRSRDRQRGAFWAHKPVHLFSSAHKFSSTLALLTDKTKSPHTDKSYILTACKRLRTEDCYKRYYFMAQFAFQSNVPLTNRVEAIGYLEKLPNCS